MSVSSAKDPQQTMKKNIHNPIDPQLFPLSI
jgi:hypothetical protein